MRLLGGHQPTRPALAGGVNIDRVNADLPGAGRISDKADDPESRGAFQRRGTSARNQRALRAQQRLLLKDIGGVAGPRSGIDSDIGFDRMGRDEVGMPWVGILGKRALEIDVVGESSNYLSRRLHAIGEGNYSVPQLRSRGSITTISLDGHVQTLPEKSWGLKNFPYLFDGQSIYIRPKNDLTIPQVVVDPTTASLANKGLLTLTGASNNYFQVRVGIVKNYFPSAGDRFVIMDLKQMQNEIAQTNLGATDPTELWISIANSTQYLKNLSASEFQGLDVQSKKELQTELRTNPNNVGLNSAYRIALLFALLIALLMYLTALPLLYRESSKIFFFLETNGVVPTKLRAALRNSLRITVSLGILIGSLIGLTVGRIFISQSIPVVSIFVLLTSLIAINELGEFFITRRFFREKRMVNT